MHLETISSIKLAKEFCEENFSDSSPFLHYDFFKLLEESKCTNKSSGWIPNHFLIKENNKTLGVIPNFKKLNSYGEYIFDQIFEQAYYQVGSDYFPKFLSGVPFTPVTRKGFIYSKNYIDFEKVINLLKEYLNKTETSSFHANFVSKENSRVLENFEFLKRTGIQYHWKNNSFSDFKDFLESMKSRKKKSIQKERKFLNEKNITFTHKVGRMITETDIKEVYRCYINTIEKKWSRPYLNLEFFRGLLKTKIIEKILVISAYNKKEILGSSIHFIGDETLYGRYWGCLKNIPYLHFELCYYQAIDFAIKMKLKYIEAGAQGEHKISRGYMPTLIYSNHWFSNQELRAPIKNYLEQESVKVDETIKYLKTYSPFSENSN